MSTHQINSTHSSMIHDIQYDYYGEKLITCASDGYVHVYDVSKQMQQNLIATIKIGDQPLWSVAWGHPRFGQIFAVSSFDGTVSVYAFQKDWNKIAQYSHSSSVNTIVFEPKFLKLACCGSDDNERQWENVLWWNAHESSIHGLAWNHGFIATASSDKSVKIWTIPDHQQKYEQTILAHTELVRAVQWHPLKPILFSGGEDGLIIITEIGENNHKILQKLEFHIPIWRIAVNLMGNQVCVSLDSNGQSKFILLEQDIDDTKYEIVEEF
ncbi:hypothetical protein pb186bvf_004179 [Paramecium bursaria]